MRPIFVFLVVTACSKSSGPNIGADADPNRDHDGDSYPLAQDCDDTDPAIHPGAPEDCSDSIDNNCNQLVDEDIECLTSCDQAIELNSSFGCRFWAVDLPQDMEEGLKQSYAIVVSNLSISLTANVVLRVADAEIASFSIPPRELRTWENAERAYNVPDPGVYVGAAIEILSDIPIAAYQFNTFETQGAASTDASLLFAEHTVTTDYFAMEYTGSSDNGGFVAIVGTKPNTSVVVEQTTPVQGATSAIVNPGDVMVVMTQSRGQTMTGSKITATEPVVVFGGNRCANVPAGVSFCDHLEQQLPPRQALGTRYAVAKSVPRTACDAEDYLRIMADADDTTVTMEPPVAGPWQLNAGEWVEVALADSAIVSATQPVMVGQFLRSSGNKECAQEGDPAFIVQVPVDQFRRDYLFLVPPTYNTDYAAIIAPPSATVVIDGTTVALEQTTVAESELSITTIELTDGAHFVSSNADVGIVVYGYGGPDTEGEEVVNVSYGYPAGLDLREINPIE